MSATLGGLIKDYRLQKNLSQLEIAFGLGWKEPSRLSRIEQGRVGNPKRKLLNRLMDAMKLTEEERNRLMLVGNYIPEDEEITYILSRISKLMNAWKYPLVVTDYLWRVVGYNKPANDIYKFDSLFSKKERQSHPNILQVLFHPDFYQNKIDGEDHEHWDIYKAHIVAHFKRVHRARTKERWYMQLVSNMMNNESFRTIWHADTEDVSKELVTRHGEKVVISPIDGKQKLLFDIFFVPVKPDPRFTIEYHTPSDLSTMKVFA